ncbi:MAG: amino acid adenylation domain-containing protein [Ardenticatenaceae bacterium]|nr:amino acid adenylation domain-containing protein [Ardenticatenaceae bacterium]MCB9446373.1 amino acid adenylation domain-containing protein [Ardenticatenaceae bacterium]
MAQLDHLNQATQQDARTYLQKKHKVQDGQIQPLAHNQQALWLIQQIAPGNSSYNIGITLHIATAIDIQAIHDALQAVIDRHPPFRTLYDSFDGEPFQIIIERQDVDFKVFDATDWTDDDLAQCLNNNLNQPFDLANDNMFRARLYVRGTDKFTLQMMTHHISADGWSAWILIRDLQQGYEARQANQPITLAPLNHQYGDFVEWQSKMLSEKGEQLWSFWREELSGGLTALNIPTDFNWTQKQQFAGASHQFVFHKDMAGQLRQLAHEEEATLYRILLAAFQVFLWLYSGQEDILIGTPVLGRSDKRFLQQIGYFVNTAVMRGYIEPQRSFREHLRVTNEKVISALAHADFPFALLVERLQPARETSHMPLTQVLFNLLRPPRNLKDLVIMSLEPTGEHAVDLGAFTASGLDIATGQQLEDYGLNLDVLDLEDKLIGDFKYSTNLYKPETVARMAEQFQVLLSNIVAAPDLPITELSMLPEDERRQVLVNWNDTAVSLPSHIPFIHQLFEQQVKQRPEATAVISGHLQLTYAELNQRANQLAHHLRSAGIGPDKFAGIFIERSPEMIVALLAVLKAGGAYLPLDPAYPPERLGLMLADVQPDVLLTRQSLLAHLPVEQMENKPLLLCLDSDWAEIARQNDQNLSPPAATNNLAYIIYTSGSTGTPKGVMVPHRALINYTLAAIDAFEMTPRDRVLQFASFSFDTSAEEIFPCLASGAALVLRDEAMIDDVSQFLQRCDDLELTVTDLPTAYWHELTAVLAENRPSLPTTLRLVIIGGEAALTEQVAVWQDIIGPRVRLLNTYGATEATIISTIYDLTSAPPSASGRVPIGRPIPNVQTYILNGQQQPVPIGVPGELWIGGAGLARGYLNRPELTAERFISNPFIDGKGAEESRRAINPAPLLYRTGDLARYLPDGNIEYLGRADSQVKIRGFRVELGEIEAALGQHPALRATAVTVHTEKNGHNRLIAYLVPHETVPTTSELRQYLQQKLPHYMIPAVFITLPEMPLSPNGKVDRQALPDPEVLTLDLARAYIPPQTPQEKLLAALWEQVLHVEQVGIHDNFFELGGHSLLATQIVSRVRKTTQIDLPIRTIFETPTIAELARHIAELQTNGTFIASRPLTPTEHTDPLPLSFSQERMWFLYQLDPDSTAYNIPGAVRLKGTLDVAALEWSINQIVIRHESLRTRFTAVNGQPATIIEPAYNFTLSIEDYRPLPAAQRLDHARETIKQAARTPFRLDRLPLFQIKLLQLDDEDYILLITMHHIISDQWSMGVLTRDLAAYYRAFVMNQDAILPEMPIQAGDHAIWQHQLAADGAFDDQMAYWKQQLKGLTSLDLPSDRPRPAVQTTTGTILTVPLPAWLLDSLHTLSQQESVSPFMILLAGFKLLLSRYTGVEDIAVGSPIANRHQLQSETLISTLVNTLVLRTDLSGNPTFRHLLHRVQKMALDAYTHQDVPFEKLVDVLQPARDTSRSPLFQAFFNVQNAPFSFPDLPNVRGMEILMIDRGAAQFDLSLSVDMIVSNTAILEYNTDLFDAARMEQLMGHLWTLLETAVTHPDRPISDLPLLTKAEIAQLDAWNDTAVPYPHDACLNHLFETQVEQTPTRTAVTFEGQSLTYKQLNQRANRLARHLLSLGVGRGDLVGINLERSLEMIVALFAVHKSGAAYIPLDPAFPQDRLDFMLADSQARVLITQTSLLADRPEGSNLQFVCVDRDAAVLAGYDDHNLPLSATAADLAYVIYTSGSTGKPKGVQIEHRSAVNFLNSMRRQPGLRAEDVILSVTTLSFDIAVLEIFLPLLNGARVELVSRDTAVNAAQLQSALTQSGATIMQATPTTWRMLLEAGWPGNNRLKILCGGEAMPRDLANQLLPRVGELWNMYGPTETTVWSSVYRVQPGDGPVSIGQPIDNTTFYILDKEQRPLPAGVPGELYIGGDGLARGYLNRPELTAEKFIRVEIRNQKAEPSNSTFNLQPSALLYRTGDLARFLADGNVEFYGRIDHQVKVRGYRIELGEIEAVLGQHPSLREVVVTTQEISSGDRRLVAYFIPETTTPTVEELRTFARASLPDYMVPAAFMALESFPLTPNKKIDRKALPAPQIVEQKTTTEFDAPRDALEIQLTRIWENVLNVSGIGRHDNFFELGGHSLLAVRVFAQIEQITQMQFPLTTLFRAPTIAQLADVLRSEGWETHWTSLVPIQPNGSRPIFFHVAPFLVSVLSFSELARHLGNDQPLYGLQPQGVEGDDPYHNCVEDMAAHYIKEIRTIQPEGPYLLGGHCAGNWVAFEMAQQLQAQGEEVSLLVLVDSEPPNITPPRINPIKYLISRAAFYWKDGRFWDALIWKLGLAYQRFVILRIGEENTRRVAAVRKAHAEAHRKYHSGTFNGDVLLIRSHESTTLQDKDWHLRWSELINGRLQHEVVPGTHAGLLIEPGVGQMAAKIRAAVDVTLSNKSE